MHQKQTSNRSIIYRMYSGWFVCLLLMHFVLLLNSLIDIIISAFFSNALRDAVNTLSTPNVLFLQYLSCPVDAFLCCTFVSFTSIQNGWSCKGRPGI